MSDAEKQKSHKRIIDAASSLFRDRGIEATSVADVMQAAGLTHGGFYRHFASKEALVRDAFKAAVDDVQAEMAAAPTDEVRRAARGEYLARYLSGEHLDDRRRGCPLAALGAEISRLDGPVRSEASRTVESMARLLNSDEADVAEQGLAMMALLLGTITLARIAETPELADAVLAAGRRGSTVIDEHMKPDRPN
ncbi:TetR/AcrR family transcriptional regulator [Roseobacter sinensis]|uniref:TetR/AcrR family transcriptional regulator n=1 Tax=Roseobacter sinensis TaxID=2931391 RepID=A0ABT3BDM2_9RHOB|nr:TetR/AcrR family transcriptional regulator [Roseobacter sp. WL0113]MCV3271668.1 TetR/AcrR family transcriptional regulator [Roseobacter sp. WL0113]